MVPEAPVRGRRWRMPQRDPPQVEATLLQTARSLVLSLPHSRAVVSTRLLLNVPCQNGRQAGRPLAMPFGWCGSRSKESRERELVEAAGVEPASESAVSKEPTYLVRFLRRLPGTLASRAQNRQETRPASLKVSPRTPRRRVQGQLTVRRPFSAHEQSRGGRQLN